jgi:alpha-beta hydrolase superfamily lysophospholipase
MWQPYRPFLKYLEIIIPYVKLIPVPSRARLLKHLTEFINDPVAIHRGKMPVRNVYVIEQLRNMIESNNVPEKIKTPFLIIHGANDMMCEPKGSVKFIERSPYPHKKLIIYPELTHMLIHDKLHLDEMANEIIGWFDKYNV